MRYAIIGFGKIGHALARAFARNGIEVAVATTRDPQSFTADAAAIGPTIIPVTLAEAVKADVIFLAVRFESHPAVAKALADWNGKTVIDAMNTQAPLDELDGLCLRRESVQRRQTGERLQPSGRWRSCPGPGRPRRQASRVSGERR